MSDLRRSGAETVSVLPEYEADLRADADRVRRHGRMVLVGLVSLTLASIVAAGLALRGVLRDTATAQAFGARYARLHV